MIGDAGGIADRITVVDFGLVKDIHSPDDTQLTNQDYLQGSPGFMAPEVILGEESTGVYIDIFSLGAVAYNLLCDRRPFEGESPVKIMMAQVNEDPPPPSEVLEREVDPELEGLIMDCLEKDPTDRPSSMVQIRRRLRQCSAETVWTMKEARAWWSARGDDVFALNEEPESHTGSTAFGQTLSVATGDVMETTDKPPPDLVIRGREQDKHEPVS